MGRSERKSKTDSIRRTKIDSNSRANKSEIDLFFKEDEVVKIFAKNSVVGGCVDTFLFCGSTS